MNQDEFLQLLAAEYAYWRDRSDGDDTTASIAIGAMGAVSNVMAALLGRPAPWHPGGKAVAPTESTPSAGIPPEDRR